MLPSLDDYLQAKNQREELIFSSENAEKRALRSDWKRNVTSDTQPKKVTLGANVPWWITPCAKNKIPIDSFCL